MMTETKVILLFVLVVLMNSQNVRIEPLSVTPGCASNTDCSSGWFCLNSVCTDKCVLMRCTSGTICKDGNCNPVCTKDSQCKQGLTCNGQYCVDQCRFTKCPADSVCQKGKCNAVPKKCKKDKDCNSGFYCSPKGVCEDKCLQSNPCLKSEICLAGKCVPIQDPVCPELIQCSDPRPTEKTCPNLIWIRKPDPIVCGIDNDGQLVDFPVQCYACKNTSITSYFNTTCDKVPQACLDSVVKEPPFCNSNEILVNGQCVEKSASSEIIFCKDPRPDEKTCPQLFWIRAPDPVVCGVDGNGNYIDFPVVCYACKQKDIVFYFNTTCDKVQKLSCDTVKCGPNSACIGGVCVPKGVWPVCKEKVKKIKCKKVRPTEETCPVLEWFVAPENIYCGVTASGQHIGYPVECYACKNPDVQYYYNQSCEYLSSPCPVEDSGLCKANVDCPKGFFCQNGLCFDNCLFMKCPSGTICRNGACEPITTSCALIKCQAPKVCQNGVCVDACQGIICIATTTCIDGQCIPIAVGKY